MRKLFITFLLSLFFIWNVSANLALDNLYKPDENDLNIESRIKDVVDNFYKTEDWKYKINKIWDLLKEALDKLNINSNKKNKKIQKRIFLYSAIFDAISQKEISLKNELEKAQKELLEKQAKEVKEKRISSNERPIWTVEITADNYSYDADKHLVYEIITTNNIVKWYELYKDLKTWKIDTDYKTQLENWFYDKNTWEIYVAYHRWRYEYIQEDLMTFDHTFIIKWTDVYYDKEKIWIFYPNQLQIQKEEDIPLTQWCTEYWSDNTIDKIYYDKNSKFFKDIFNEINYTYNYVYFCNENEAITAWYKKSLN